MVGREKVIFVLGALSVAESSRCPPPLGHCVFLIFLKRVFVIVSLVSYLECSWDLTFFSSI